ncbi:uncharacterized protein SOCE836_077420 [Sorangium cellulosum]|uniref:Uncharacterized protein n=1 Tax=Sorangium cellulosum TaxID=56 RepID=A0A4P2QZ03_SORCE|nr:uncharacterized protein SOCE836_077420 [Sorangium cellulosum]WCQ94848.1 hypothetical protein NQZ70_07619 [Sorangium sp. Soce836]
MARSGRHRRERAHDTLGVVAREGRDRDAAGDQVHVAVEPVGVLLHAALWLHVVGVHAREFARGPQLAELLEGDLLRCRAVAGDDLRLCGASTTASMTSRSALRSRIAARSSSATIASRVTLRDARSRAARSATSSLRSPACFLISFGSRGNSRGRCRRCGRARRAVRRRCRSSPSVSAACSPSTALRGHAHACGGPPACGPARGRPLRAPPSAEAAVAEVETSGSDTAIYLLYGPVRAQAPHPGAAWDHHNP